MNLEEFLTCRDADLDSIVATARDRMDIGPADILLAVGSLVEGLGNSRSDLDLLLITPRDAGGLPPGDVAVVVGTCLADMQVLRVRAVEELLTRFNAWSEQPWDVSREPAFPPADRRLLHRLLESAVLFEGADGRLSSLRPDRDRLARLKLQVARHIARTIQVDMAGYRETGDYQSLVFAAQDLLGHAVDALAAGHRLTNPIAKWRSRILARLPADWERSLRTRPTGASAVEVFWSLHRAPPYPDAAAVLPWALRIVAFARAVFVWAERRLVRLAPEAPNRIDWTEIGEAVSEPPLPYLDLDVDFAEEDGTAALGRLNGFGDALELSSDEFEVSLLFDGVTTPAEAARAVYGPDATDAARQWVRRVIDGVARSGLSVPVQTSVAA